VINFAEANLCVNSKCDYRRVICCKDFLLRFTPRRGTNTEQMRLDMYHAILKIIENFVGY